MRRFLAGFLAMVLLFVSVASAAVAEKQLPYVYAPVQIILSNQVMSQDEEAFRQWASELVSLYRSEYAVLQEDKSDYTPGVVSEMLKWVPGVSLAGDRFDIEGSDTIEEPHWIMERVRVESMAQYYPYYLLGKAKSQFDVSTHAHGQNMFGVETLYTDYTIVDLDRNNGKRNEIYMWLLIESLKEKAETAPGYLTEYRKNVNGCYVFNVSTGKMEYDATLQYTQESAQKRMEADWQTVVVDSIDLAWKATKCYSDLQGASVRIANDAASKVAEKTNWTEIVDEFKQELINSLGECLTKSLETAVDEFEEQAQTELSNKTRGLLAVELANQLNQDKNALINYLKTTYVDNVPDSISNSGFPDVIGFKKAAEDLIEKLEGSSSKIEETAEKWARDWTGIEAEISDEQIIYDICLSAIDTLLTGFMKSLRKLADDSVTAWIEKTWSENEQNIIKSVKDFILDDLWNHFVAAIPKGIEEALKKHGPDDVTNEGQCNSLFEDVCTEISVLWDIENIGSFLGSSIISRATEILGVAIDCRLTASSEESGKKGVDPEKALDAITNGTKVSAQQWLISSILLGVKIPIFNCFDEIQKTSTFMSEADQADLKGYIKHLKSAINTLENKTDSDSVLKLMTQIEGAFLWLMSIQSRYKNETGTDMVDWLKTNMSKSMINLGSFDGEAVRKALKTALQDKNVWQSMVNLGEGFDAEKTKEYIAELEAYGKDKGWDKIENLTSGAYTEIKNKAEEEVKKSWSKLFGDIMDVVESVGQAAWDLGTDIVIAENSTWQVASGENLVSLEAIRIYFTYLNSKAIENHLRSYTIGGGRTAAILSGNADGIVDHEYGINAEEILDPIATPNLKTIKVLTDHILMQMNLDVIGMGGYCTMVANRDKYIDTSFYMYYLRSGVLLNDAAAEKRQGAVTKAFNDAKTGYREEWNALFAQ